MSTLADQRNSVSTLGFWIYLMTDCVLFASLFAVYAVMHGSTFGGPSGHDLFDFRFVLIETVVLLTSSFSCGLAIYSMQLGRKNATFGWLVLTGLLGLSFLGLELSEFHHLAAMGDSWRRSGFLSAYFTLVGTHGLHIVFGLLWLIVLGVKLGLTGLTERNIKRIGLFSLFWHFLDLIWIFIFSMVYFIGGTLS